jgi:hypothetical protein
MSTIENVLEKGYLEIKNSKINYGFAPIPSPIDEKISSLIKLFIQVSPAERLIFYEKARSPIPGFFLNFAERAATLAVREQSRQWIVEGLIALIIENCRAGDCRDTIVRLAPLYHAAGKIGLDADTLFREIASYIDNEAAKHMRNFPDRLPYQKSLKAFYYKEVDTPEGFRYEEIPW